MFPECLAVHASLPPASMSGGLRPLRFILKFLWGSASKRMRHSGKTRAPGSGEGPSVRERKDRSLIANDPLTDRPSSAFAERWEDGSSKTRSMRPRNPRHDRVAIRNGGNGTSDHDHPGHVFQCTMRHRARDRKRSFLPVHLIVRPLITRTSDRRYRSRARSRSDPAAVVPVSCALMTCRTPHADRMY